MPSEGGHQQPNIPAVSPLAFISIPSLIWSKTAATPRSPRMDSPTSFALATIAASEDAFLSALVQAGSIIFSVFSMRLSCCPQPSFMTNSAHWNWSMPKGVTIVGTPARSATCVVPAPPWCSVRQQRGISHSCEATSRKSTLVLMYSRIPKGSSAMNSLTKSTTCSEVILLHPLTKTTRSLTNFALIRTLVRTGASMGMLPQPT
mmetsp:Transcript_32338/g.87655  ORF Transcript_32338/g.87655 Transcript_32338/m.87655 type:complete len:204 (+) Transcript_32338:74-685(+)